MKWTNLNRAYTDRLEYLAGLSPYELLEVPKDVSESDLRAAYLAKVKAYHPDLADEFTKQLGERILKLINNAYEAIKRKRGHGC